MTLAPEFNKKRSWPEKFRDAFLGIGLGIRGQSSFRVHLVAALLVVTGGMALQVSLIQWCLLVICITLVLMAEMFNSALEALAPVIDPQYNRHLAVALDVGSAAVLLAALGAAIVGAIIFGSRLVALFL